MKKKNKIEIGKTYKGLVNNIIFKVVGINTPIPYDSQHKTVYYKICFEDGKTLEISDAVLSHLSMKEI